MSLESVKHFLAAKAPDLHILTLERPSETVWLSAFLAVQPAQIAKALALRVGDRTVLLMACGDARLSNQKLKFALGGKARMLPPEEAAAITGHPVGGVCPFGLAAPLPVYCDTMLKRFEEVVTGGGEPRSAIRINPLRLADVTRAEWVDVCEEPGT